MPASKGDDEGRKMSKISINWNGIQLKCEYEYEPEEKATRTDPGCEEYFAVVSAKTPSGFDLVHEYGGVTMMKHITESVREALIQEGEE